MKETENNSSYREENHNEVHQIQNEDIQSPKVSSFKIIASQLVAILPIIFIKLRFGMGMGYTTVLIPELSKKNADVDVTLDELTWFSSYCFVIPVGAISGGYIAQSLGVRRLFMFSCLLHMLADLLFHWADSAAMILFAQVIVGITAGVSKAPTFTYTAEALQPKYRSMAMAAMTLSTTFGSFFAIFLGNFMHWRTQTFFFLVFSIIGFVLVHFIPESPQWLANKNRFEDAEKSLARLRGWTAPEDVKAELYSFIVNASDLVSQSESVPENKLHSTRRIKLKQALSLYLHRSFYIPLSLLTAMFFFAEFNGSSGITTFSGLLFEEIESPIDRHIGSTIIPGLSIFSGFIYIFSVRYLGKRILTLGSVFVVATCHTIAAILLYLKNYNVIESEIYSWIISVAIMLIPFSYNIGLGKVIFILNSELFPQKLRYVGAGIGYCVFQIITAIFAKTFLYIVKAITFPNTLIVFVIINVASFIFIYFILPETEGVTLQKIEEHYTGKNTLKYKH